MLLYVCDSNTFLEQLLCSPPDPSGLPIVGIPMRHKYSLSLRVKIGPVEHPLRVCELELLRVAPRVHPAGPEQEPDSGNISGWQHFWMALVRITV